MKKLFFILSLSTVAAYGKNNPIEPQSSSSSAEQIVAAALPALIPIAEEALTSVATTLDGVFSRAEPDAVSEEALLNRYKNGELTEDEFKKEFAILMAISLLRSFETDILSKTIIENEWDYALSETATE